MQPQPLQNIIQEAITVSRNTFGHMLRQVWLYGSHARNEATEDSDIDIMVVLSEPVETWKYNFTVYNDFTIDMLNQYGELPAVFITNEETFTEAPSQLYRNVKNEGILVYG